MIQTPNLQLLPIERIHVEALLRSKSELAALLLVAVPDGWPHFPEAFSLAALESDAYHLLEADWGATFFYIGKTAYWLATEHSKVHPTTRGRSRSDMKSLPNTGIADGQLRRPKA